MPFIDDPFAERRRSGYKTELYAAEFLKSKGWSILAQNQKIAHVQIDILARNESGLLVLVEVKSKRSLHFGVLGKGQKSRLKRVIECLSVREPTALMVLVEDERLGFLEIPIED